MMYALNRCRVAEKLLIHAENPSSSTVGTPEGVSASALDKDTQEACKHPIVYVSSYWNDCESKTHVALDLVSRLRGGPTIRMPVGKFACTKRRPQVHTEAGRMLLLVGAMLLLLSVLEFDINTSINSSSISSSIGLDSLLPSEA